MCVVTPGVACRGRGLPSLPRSWLWAYRSRAPDTARPRDEVDQPTGRRAVKLLVPLNPSKIRPPLCAAPRFTAVTNSTAVEQHDTGGKGGGYKAKVPAPCSDLQERLKLASGVLETLVAAGPEHGGQGHWVFAPFPNLPVIPSSDAL